MHKCYDGLAPTDLFQSIEFNHLRFREEVRWLQSQWRAETLRKALVPLLLAVCQRRSFAATQEIGAIYIPITVGISVIEHRSRPETSSPDGEVIAVHEPVAVEVTGRAGNGLENEAYVVDAVSASTHAKIRILRRKEDSGDGGSWRNGYVEALLLPGGVRKEHET